MSDLCLILHTHERSDYLLRWINYYSDFLITNNYTAIIVDSSSLSNKAILLDFDSHNFSYIHCANLSLERKLYTAINKNTKYFSLICADDDFYSFFWIEKALNFLRKEESYSIVYGEELTFENNYCFKRNVIKNKYYLSNQNPQQKNLSSENADDRISQLSKSDWATTSWYALHKTNELKIFIKKALDYNLNGYYFERYLIFYHALTARTERMPIPFLIREKTKTCRPLYCILKHPMMSLKFPLIIISEISNYLSFGVFRSVLIAFKILKYEYYKQSLNCIPDLIKKIIRKFKLKNINYSEYLIDSSGIGRDESFINPKIIKTQIIDFSEEIDKFLLRYYDKKL
jgi:glycosyltransferase domain-containing protein